MLYQELIFCKFFLMFKCYKIFHQVDSTSCILAQQGKHKCRISSNHCAFPGDNPVSFQMMLQEIVNSGAILATQLLQKVQQLVVQK